MSITLVDLIHTRLQSLDPIQLQIIDESHHHVGHIGAKEGGKHFAVEIISPAFEGLSLIKRHQMVYDAVRDLLNPKQIHALKIKAHAPGEAKVQS